MHTFFRSIALSVSLLFGVAHAQVSVQDAWVRATVPAQLATGAFMRLHALTDSKLVAASSPIARAVEVHEMTMENDVMRMRQVPFLALPAEKIVSLSPGGYHLMLLGLRRQAKEGDVVPVSLVIEGRDGSRQTLKVAAVVRGLAAGRVAQDRGGRH